MPRILVVDDSAPIRALVKSYLAGDGFEFQEAEDGRQALELMRQDPPDLVVSDLHMPNVDGPALCELATGDPKLRGVPIIILTAEKDPVVRLVCQEKGARAVLQKPVNAAQLLQEVFAQLPGAS